MNKDIFLVLCLLIKISVAYKPVVLIHGILTGAESMLVIEEEIKRVSLFTFFVCFVNKEQGH